MTEYCLFSVRSIKTMASRNVRSWYCIETNWQSEHLAQDMLAHQGYRTFIPEYLIPSKKKSTEFLTKPFFPGYMFVGWDANQLWSPVLTTPGVKGFVSRASNDNGKAPSPMLPGEVERLQKQLDREKQILVGGQVEVTHGSFLGQVGLCKLAEHDRITLLFRMFGTEITYTFSRSQVRGL